MRFLFCIILILIFNQVFCQIDFYIETDEYSYSFGQDVHITFNLHNTGSDTVSVPFISSFPFSYYIDDEQFGIGAYDIFFYAFIPPDSTISYQHIHTDFISIGNHILIGEFFHYPYNWITDPISISIDQVGSDFSDFQLKVNQISNYPNPFNPSTTISFSIPDESDIELMIYNIKGQKIKTLANEQYSKGEHSIVWNGDDDSGNLVRSGIYFYKLNVNGKTEAVKKCLLLK